MLWIATTGWCFAVIGLGRWWRPLLGRHAIETSLAFSVLLGLASAQTLSLLWNFVAPISAEFAGALLVIGWIGLTLPQRLYGPRLDAERAALLAGMAIAIVPWLTTRVHYQHDVGFYALPSVRWAHASALPLGLANLNLRFGSTAVGTCSMRCCGVRCCHARRCPRSRLRWWPR